MSSCLCRDAARREAEEAGELAWKRAAEAEECRQSAAEARTAERAALDAVAVAEGGHTSWDCCMQLCRRFGTGQGGCSRAVRSGVCLHLGWTACEAWFLQTQKHLAGHVLLLRICIWRLVFSYLGRFIHISTPGITTSNTSAHPVAPTGCTVPPSQAGPVTILLTAGMPVSTTGTQRSAEAAAAAALEALTAAQASEREAVADAESSRKEAQR